MDLALEYAVCPFDRLKVAVSILVLMDLALE